MAFQSQTFANSNTAYYGSPADWSKYSTINDTIRFNSTNATLQVFPAVPDSATSIAFNGNQLAYISDLPNLANWAQFPANASVTVPSPYRVITQNVSNDNGDILLLANRTSPLGGPTTIDVRAQGGNGGNINLRATAGNGGVSGGDINLTAEGGSGLLGLNGRVDIVADSGSSAIVGVTTGGVINLTANSGINDVSLTSAIKLSAAGVNIQSGITSPIVSLAGYTFIGGNSGVNICGGIPPILPNVPGTTYIYGTTGIELNSDVYTTRVFPYWSGATPVVDDLVISGRAAGLFNNEAYVKLNLVSTITGKKIDIQSNSTLYISSANVYIEGVSSINGQVYPPPAGTSNFVSTATSALNMVNFPILSTLSMNFTKPIPTVADTLGIQSAISPTSTLTVIQAYEPTSVTNPPIIKGMRTSQMLLTLGTPNTAPTSYGKDLMLSNGAGNGRITATQYNNTSLVSTFTVAYLSDPPNLYEFYISPSGINENFPERGSGKLLNPWQTIAYALTQIASISDTIPVYLYLSAGVHGGAFTITRNNTFLVGNTPQQENIDITTVSGAVIVQISGATTTKIKGGFSFINFSRVTTLINQAKDGDFTVTNCSFFNNGAGWVPLLLSASAGFESIKHIYNFTNCNFTSNSQGSNAMVVRAGKGNFLLCNFNIDSATAVIQGTQTGSMSLQYCNVINTYAQTGLPFTPLIFLSNNVTTIDYKFNFCRIEYTSKVVDAGLNKCCIQLNNTAGTNLIFEVTYCLLLCEGARRTNFGTNYQCIQDLGPGTATCNYGNLLAEATAHHITTAINKVEFVTVP